MGVLKFPVSDDPAPKLQVCRNFPSRNFPRRNCPQTNPPPPCRTKIRPKHVVSCEVPFPGSKTFERKQYGPVKRDNVLTECTLEMLEVMGAIPAEFRPSGINSSAGVIAHYDKIKCLPRCVSLGLCSF